MFTDVASSPSNDYRWSPSSSPQRPRAGRAPRLLIVDDDCDQLFLLRVFLEGRGYKTCVANSSSEALREFESSPIDAIVCDILMPGCNGIQLIRRLRETAKQDTPPVVFISSGAARPLECFGGASEIRFCPKERLFSELPSTLDALTSRE
jgi:CheY-like chemotaxis protein